MYKYQKQWRIQKESKEKRNVENDDEWCSSGVFDRIRLGSRDKYTLFKMNRNNSESLIQYRWANEWGVRKMLTG